MWKKEEDENTITLLSIEMSFNHLWWEENDVRRTRWFVHSVYFKNSANSFNVSSYTSKLKTEKKHKSIIAHTSHQLKSMSLIGGNQIDNKWKRKTRATIWCENRKAIKQTRPTILTILVRRIINLIFHLFQIRDRNDDFSVSKLLCARLPRNNFFLCHWLRFHLILSYIIFEMKLSAIITAVQFQANWKTCGAPQNSF